MRDQTLRGIEIETTTICNWRCVFCPVSVDLKKPATMSMDLFNLILDRAVNHGTITNVSINSYNEPTLDKHFEERVQAIAAHGLRLTLHTNGSGLSPERLAFLKASGALYHITYNFPSTDKATFAAMTGAKNYDHVTSVIDETARLGLSFDIRVNGILAEVYANYGAILARWPGAIKNFPATNDRSGILKNKYAMNIAISTPRLTGCVVPDQWLFVNVHGEAFLCCEDYYQKTTYGSLVNSSIADLRSSPAYQTLYRQVEGLEDAAKDLICRKCFLMHCQYNKAKS